MQIDPNEAESLDLGPGKASRAFQSMKNAQASTCSLTGRPYQNCQACRQLWRQQRAAAAVQNVLGLKAADSACVVQESYLDEESIRHYRQHKQQEEEEQRHRQQEQAAAGAVSDEVCLHALCAWVCQGGQSCGTCPLFVCTVMTQSPHQQLAQAPAYLVWRRTPPTRRPSLALCATRDTPTTGSAPGGPPARRKSQSMVSSWGLPAQCCQFVLTAARPVEAAWRMAPLGPLVSADTVLCLRAPARPFSCLTLSCL